MLELEVSETRPEATLFFKSGRRRKKLSFSIDSISPLYQVDKAIGKMMLLITKQYVNHRKRIIKEYSRVPEVAAQQLITVRKIEKRLKQISTYKTRGIAVVIYELRQDLWTLAPGKLSRFREQDSVFLDELLCMCQEIINRKEETIKTLTSI